MRLVESPEGVHFPPVHWLCQVTLESSAIEAGSLARLSITLSVNA